LQEGSGLARNERILYGEIARLRYLVGHGFKLILGGEKPTAAAWKKITTQVEERGDEIVAELLSRRKRGTLSWLFAASWLTIEVVFN
jgi:hypothetical protein